jgi:hypothetical protein
MANARAPSAKRPQFTLARIFVAMLFAVVLFTCIGGIYREHQARQTALYLLEEIGGKLSTATPPGKKPDHRTQLLTFVKPIDDAKLLKIAPYARWLPTVTEVDLTGSEITSSGVGALAELPNLHRLVLTKTQVDNEVVAYLASHGKLVDVSLSDTQIGDTGVAALIAQAPQLERLFLANTPVTDVAAEHIRLAKGLIELDLSAKGVTDAGVHELKRLARLERLALAGSQAGPGSITALEKLPALRDVVVTSTAFQPDDVARLERALPKVTVTK